MSFSKNQKMKGSLTWEAPEYFHQERGFLWYGVVGIFLLALVTYAISQGAWSFAIALLLFAGVYKLLFHEKPKVIPVEVSEEGIYLGEKHYPFSQLKSFWIQELPPLYRFLMLRTHSRLMPDLQVEVAEEDISQIRMFLKTHLPELDQEKAPLADIFVKIFKL